MKTTEMVKSKTEVEQISKPQINFSQKRNVFPSYNEGMSMIK